MSAAPLVTAVVCTYNRSESLRDTLNSLKKQSLAGGAALEIIVVDNNSTDRTPQIVQEAAADSPWPIRAVVEENQGIAHARNRGLREARGEFIAFIDDDAIAETDWVSRLIRCFQETGSDMVGGKVEVLWLTPRPEWLSNDLLGPMPRVDFGGERKRCTRMNETFLTTNCSMRRAVLQKYGIFDTTLGRRRDRWVGGEDVELCQRWITAGAVVYYEPGAVVHHKIGPERVTPTFYRRWFEDIGYTQGHQLGWKWHLRLTIMPVWRWKAFFGAWAKYASSFVLSLSKDERSSNDRKLQTELWWLFQRSFLKERFSHWRAYLLGTSKPACHFARSF